MWISRCTQTRLEPSRPHHRALTTLWFRSVFTGKPERAALSWLASKLTVGSSSSTRFAVGHSEVGPPPDHPLDWTSPRFELLHIRRRVRQRWTSSDEWTPGDTCTGGPVATELGLRDSVLRRWVDKLREEPASAA